jgi:hypothetical protein
MHRAEAGTERHRSWWLPVIDCRGDARRRIRQGSCPQSG